MLHLIGILFAILGLFTMAASVAVGVLTDRAPSTRLQSPTPKD